MKNKFNLIMLIAVMMIAAFSFVSCDMLDNEKDKTEENSITITVTGNFSQFNGWKAGIQLASPDKSITGALAYASYVNVTSSTNSISFPLFTNNTLTTPLETAGNYFIAFWFEKTNEDDVDFYIESKQLTKGNNTITFASFKSLKDSNGGDLPAALIGTWTKEGDATYRLEITNSTFHLGYFPSYGAGGYDDYEIISYEGTTVTLGYDDGEVFKSFEVYVSGGKLIISGITGENASYNGTYTSGGIEWPSNAVWIEYDLPGLQKPAGSSVSFVETYLNWDYAYLDELIVTLDASKNAFEDLKDQLDTLNIEYDEENEADYGHLQAYYNNSKNNLSITYDEGVLTIHITKPYALLNNSYSKGSGADYRTIIFDWDGGIRFFIGSVSTPNYEAVIESIDEYGNIQACIDNNSYFQFTVNLNGDTLIISDMPDDGYLDLSTFDGTYTRAGG